MVVLLLVSGYIGLRIVALEAQLDSLGALTELSLRHKEWVDAHRAVKEMTQKKEVVFGSGQKKKNRQRGFKPVLRWLLKPLLADQIRRGSRSAGSWRRRRQKISDHIPAESHPVQTSMSWDDAPVFTTAWRHDLDLVQIKTVQIFVQIIYLSVPIFFPRCLLSISLNFRREHWTFHSTFFFFFRSWSYFTD